MRGKIVLIASLAVALAAVAVGFTLLRSSSPPSISCPDFQEGKVTIGETQLSVAVAATAAEKTQGLSGCAALPANAGMLFPYDSPKQAAFWMKDMLIPIDIIWIREGKVVGITSHVPPPPSGAPDEELPQYRSPGAIDAVLEIKSGGAAEYGIATGSPVTLPN